ncbi:hypothetical protein [Ligilactobacillus faecis]|nr:hypothetical protein [Ligilactobacillus faecis]WGN89550.1 hypothetical protein QFX10_00120 [Ligilactobacillus faecis]
MGYGLYPHQKELSTKIDQALFFMVHRKELVGQITADLIASDVNMDYVVV